MFRMRKLDLNKGQSKTLSKPDSFRRNTTMFPECSSSGREVQDTLAVRFHHLLVSLEGGERTGCLKIESARTRSRSAILLYRGRVVGCVYGRKSMVCQHLAEDAHKYALSDLASPGNLVEAYELSEEMVLSAAALFNGHPVHLEPGPVPEHVFEQAMATVVQSGLPGCVVLTSNSNETVCIVYVFAGQIVGVHSATSGWLKNTKPEALRQYVRELGPVRILGALLPARNGKPDQLGFSLTGLGDRPCIAAARLQSIEALSETGVVVLQQQPAQMPGGAMGTPRTHAHGRNSHVKRASDRSTFNITPG